MFHSNNHMDPDNSENPNQSLPCCQNVSVFNNDWENIACEVLYLVGWDLEVCCACTSNYPICGVNTVARVLPHIPIHHQRWRKKSDTVKSGYWKTVKRMIWWNSSGNHVLLCLRKFHHCGQKKAVGVDMVLISLQSFSWTVQGANIYTFRSYTRGYKGEIDANTFWSYTQGCKFW